MARLADRMRAHSMHPPRPAVWATAAGVLLADQVGKSLVLATDPNSADHWGGGWFSVRLVRNTGASFGIGSGHPVVITVVALLAVVAITMLVSRTRRRSTALAWAVVLGGALGNLADRIFRSPGPGRGAVVDWIHVAGYPATFNLADIAIRVGAIAAILTLARSGRVSAGRPCKTA